MNISQGNLVIVDATTVFWRGWKVPGVESLRVHSDDDEVSVKIRLSPGSDAVVVQDMIDAGIQVKVRA